MPRRKSDKISATSTNPLPIDPPSYGKLINISLETNPKLLQILQPIADKDQAVLLAFIAPSLGKKISPVDFLTASIGFWEELGIEEAVRDIQKATSGNIKKLYLLIESPGGLVDSSYKISRHLRYQFSEITSFVPHIAASGGTLMALSADKVVMGDMASLTPIDVQIPYGRTMVSVNRMNSALATLVKFFETKLPEQVPYPYKAMVDKLDPIVYDDWNSKTNAMIEYAAELLSKAGYQPDEMVSIAQNLILTNKPHNFVVHKDLAKEVGVKVANDGELMNELNCMRWWLKDYMLSPGTEHYIRYVVPQAQVTSVVTNTPSPVEIVKETTEEAKNI